MRVVLGGCFFVILAGLAAMILLMVIPYIRLRPVIQCSRQLKQVYGVLYAYADDNSWKFPANDNDLTQLYSPKYSKGVDLFKALKCPGTTNVINTPTHLKDNSTAVIGPGMSYLYKGDLSPSTNNKSQVHLLWDQSPQNHGGKGINVLYTNGTVKFTEDGDTKPGE